MAISSAGEPARILSIEPRTPPARLGVAVVQGLVDAIVSGEIGPGETLPPEAPLARQFGVSRTVLRESVKRIEEKGLLRVAQGRGTQVRPMHSWNILDPVVLTALINHDDSLGILDELSVVRAHLESAMTKALAERRTEADLERLGSVLQAMRNTVSEPQEFRDADVQFHETVMELSGNRLAESISRILFERALDSTRYHGIDPLDQFQRTLREHEAIFAAIAGQQPSAAGQAMELHILDSWQRRRLPTHRPRS